MPKEFREDKKNYEIKNISTGERFSLYVRNGFFAQSACMFPVLQKIWHFSGVESNPPRPIYLRGETGVGKTELAEIFHYNSCRKNESFIDINCASIPEDLFETEFFGSVKGAFTGAVNKTGIFQLADKGTVFLDEINKLTMAHQGKLLTAIEKQEARKVGAETTYSFNVRLISASNESLMKLVQDGKFREDLFYRLEGINIFIPPLRDREQDILDLARDMLKRHNKDRGEERKITFSDEFEWALKNYNYPGNIRRLNMIIEKCIGQCDIEGKKLIDLQVALNASDQGKSWMGFGLDSKSDLVRFYENYLHEMDFKNKSLHDLAVEIVSSFQNDNMIEELCKQDEIMEGLKSKLQLNRNHAIGINDSTKELINKLIKALNRLLGSKSIEKDDVLNFLKEVDHLEIFTEINDIEFSAIQRLYKKGRSYDDLGRMLGITAQAVSQRIKNSQRIKKRNSNAANGSGPT